jgi:hypothetical protein
MGRPYHGAGTYKKTLKASSGCDSIATLKLGSECYTYQYNQCRNLYKPIAVQAGMDSHTMQQVLTKKLLKPIVVVIASLRLILR